MTVAVTPEKTGSASADELLERLFEASLGAFDVFAVALGDRLGYYRALHEHGAMTSSELADRTSTDERYTREWLEQQAVSGILEVAEESPDGLQRRFALPSEYETVLVDPRSTSTGTPMARIVLGAVSPFEQIVDAYRTGAGVPYEDYGVDLLEGQAGMNRPQFEHYLGSSWIPAMPDIHQRLESKQASRVADIGMGAGWSSIAFAKAYPNAIVDGFDLDQASVDLANANAKAEGVSDRVTFHVRDAGDSDLAGRYDLATAFECIHDMDNPVSVLSSMRRLVGDGGTVLVMDEGVADEFTAPGDEVERFMYGFSFLHCLPVGRVETPSAGTGTVMRASTFGSYAEGAGFKRIEVLPIENDFFRFYRLTS